MHITPIEIRQKQFENKFRGYNKDEVDAFLHSLAHAWEKLTTQLGELKATLEEYKKNIERLENIENALLQTVQHGEVAAAHMVEQAKRESELMIKTANFEAEQLLQEARKKVVHMEEQARQEVNQLKASLAEELAITQASIKEAAVYKETINKQLQRLGKELLEKAT